MHIRSYTRQEIRTGRARAEKPLLTAVLAAQAMFCYADDNWIILAVSLVVMGASWLAAHRHKEVYMSRLMLNLNVLLIGVALAVRYILGDQELLVALGHYVMLIQICKLFERKSRRDYVQMIVMSLLLVLASSLICQELLFALLFFAYVYFLSKAGMALTIRRAMALTERGDEPESPADTWPARAIVSRLAVVLIAVAASGTVVFLVVPRSLASGAGPIPQRRSSGFDATVQLGQRRNIHLSDRIVMRMRMVEPTSRQGLGALSATYLRGRSFGRYYDSQWMKNHSPRRPLYANLAPQSLLDKCAAQEISMVPSLLPVAFASWPAVMVKMDNATVSHLGNLEYAIKLPVNLDRPVRYTAMVMLGEPSASGKRALTWISDRLSRAQPSTVPPDVPPRVTELARRWCADQLRRRRSATSDDQLDRINIEIAETIAEKLRSQYDYTLDLTDVDPTRDGVDDFLFRLKRGHCEYFASAMTVMCQTLGLRARLVTGFAGGQYDSSTQDYTFRLRDAHAWTEVYTGLTGWRTFDATPAARFEPEPTSTAGQWWADARHAWRDVEFAWFSRVIGYSDTDRNNIIGYARQHLAGLGGFLKRKAGEVWQALVELFAKGRMSMTAAWFFLCLAATAATAAGLIHLRRARWRRGGRRARSPAAPRPPAFVRQLLKLLARRSFRPTPDQTARQWSLQAVERLDLPADNIRELIDLYDRLRWSGQAVGKDELSHAEQRVRALAADVRG